MKSRIVEELGQAEILLPGLVAGGMRANDRAKARLSALQAAAGHARDPHGAFSDLAAECRSAGVDAIAVKSLIAAARSTEDGAIDAPGLGKLGEDLSSDVDAMIAAVSAGDEERGRVAQDRLAAIKANSRLGMQQITQAEIAELTAVPSAGADSLHRLIMDLHKDLNRLAAQCAEEIVAGAHAHGLRAEDRALVGAFMRGFNRTRGRRSRPKPSLPSGRLSQRRNSAAACSRSSGSSRMCRTSNSPSRTAGSGSCRAVPPSGRRGPRSRSRSISCKRESSRNKRVSISFVGSILRP